MHAHDSTRPRGIAAFLRAPAGAGLCIALVIAGAYLIAEHAAHTPGALPYLLFLLCPIMHLFMHGSHGGNHGHADHAGHSDERAR